MSRRLFEGPDAATVLDRVHTELGPGARIVSAEKVRQGGIAGFFTRERVEVVVEVPDGPPLPPAATSPGAFTEAPRTETATATATATAATGAAADPPAARRTAGAGRTGVGADEARMRAMLDLVEARNAEEQAADTVLIEAPVADVPVAAAPVTDVSRADVPTRHPGDFAALLAGARARLEEEDARSDAAGAAGPAVDGSAALDLATDPVDGPLDDVLGGAPDDRAGHGRTPLSLVRPGGGAAPGRVTTPVADVPVTCAPLPSRPGTVVAVVDATGSDPLAAASRLAPIAGCDVDDVVLASPSASSRRSPWLALDDPGEASARRRAWWRRPGVTLVAVDTGDGEWSTRMLAALEPTLTVAVVDARHKPEDVGHEIARVGGVDALAVEHLGLTRRPTTLTDLALPLASMDGRAATPERWLELSRRGEPDRRPPGPTDRPRPPTPTTVPGG